VLAQDGSNYQARLGLGTLLAEQGRRNEAIEHLSRLTEGYPNSAEAFLARAEVYAQNGQPLLAEYDYDQAVGIDPKNPELVLARAQFYRQQGQKGKALADYEQAISLGVPRAALAEAIKACK